MRFEFYNIVLTGRVALNLYAQIDGVNFKGIRFYIGHGSSSTDEEPTDEEPTEVTFWYSDEQSRANLRKSLTAALHFLNTNDASL